jgi:hypothetical protein
MTKKKAIMGFYEFNKSFLIVEIVVTTVRNQKYHKGKKKKAQE